jgi:hypothetical protein
MIAHKFKVGQTVQIIPGGYLANARGTFTIVCVLPEEHGVYHYRIRSTTDGERGQLMLSVAAGGHKG